MILEKIGEAATWENLAEECAELAQAALKVARILRGENPTPLTIHEALAKVNEEFTDVAMMAEELTLEPCNWIRERKLHRFNERWKEREQK